MTEFAAYWSRFADTLKYCFLGESYELPRLAARRRPFCRDIRREMHVRSDGRIPLRGGHQEWIGDLSTSKVAEVWHSNRIAEVRARHQERDLATLEMFETCQFW